MGIFELDCFLTLMTYNSEMISFSELGEYGRLGNQLFQYAYLRAQAKRLGTQFYCPQWVGDTIFNLQDRGERCGPFVADSQYFEGNYKHGYNPAAQQIKNGTDVHGYFQSEKFFTKDDIFKWFSFNESVFTELNKKYSNIDFANSTAIHLRLGDYLNPSLQFYVAKRSYFKKALVLTKHKKHVLVFSDNPTLAKKFLGNVSDSLVFVEGNRDFEDFYLMTRCHDIVCSPSSYSWWAAYLNRFEDKTVIMPTSWFLPGSRTTNKDIFVSGWIRLPAHRFFDHYYLRALPIKLTAIYKRFFSRSLFSRSS